MSEPYLGEVKIIAWNYAPKGWAFCNGQLLPINQNQALFSLLGTFYGGNGTTTFALPNLQGRVPVHVSNTIVLGQLGGEATHTLIVSEMPAHNHQVLASSTPANTGDPTGNLWAAGNAAYNTSSNTTMAAACLAFNGGQPHDNMSPYLVLNFIIALQGIFPTRD